MGSGSTVKTPDGAQWRVRRRWLDRPLPDLRQRYKANRQEVSDGSAFNATPNLDLGEAFAGDNPAAIIAALVLMVVVIFVVLPLLGVALELIGVLALLGAGLFGRVVLGRPWIVIGEKLGDPEERVAFAVKGWRDSSAALRELRTALAATGPPEHLAVGKPLATKRPSAANYKSSPHTGDDL
jgi:hypothetical protein